MASSSVDFPAPVLPVMAINPACAKGACSNKISCSPAMDAKLLKLTRKIFIAFILVVHQALVGLQPKAAENHVVRLDLGDSPFFPISRQTNVQALEVQDQWHLL